MEAKLRVLNLQLPVMSQVGRNVVKHLSTQHEKSLPDAVGLFFEYNFIN